MESIANLVTRLAALHDRRKALEDEIQALKQDEDELGEQILQSPEFSAEQFKREHGERITLTAKHDSVVIPWSYLNQYEPIPHHDRQALLYKSWVEGDHPDAVNFLSELKHQARVTIAPSIGTDPVFSILERFNKAVLVELPGRFHAQGARLTPRYSFSRKSTR